MNPLVSTSAPANGASTLHDLFALTDEQILQIEPEVQDVEVVSDQQSAVGGEASREPKAPAATVHNDKSVEVAPDGQAGGVQHQQPPTVSSEEPPPWLAAQMKDPWNGEEARELWNGAQQAKSEAAAYRSAFATPEDARALKELYPGGVSEARTAAERARVLDDIDRAYFGAAGKSAQDVSASRAQLAQRMLHEDPAAFREMVFAGLRSLEAAGNQLGGASVGATLGSPSANGGKAAVGGASPAPVASSVAAANEAHVAAYAAFERAANEDLDRSVGAAIERTLAQTLPNASRVSNASGVGAQHAAPLQARLSQAIRQDVEAALKGDRQLGEQVAQILSGRRLDEETRVQVVRLIGERAQQLVPGAAKRVLNDWTQTALSAHRSKTARADTASARREVASAAPASASAREPGPGSSRSATRSHAVDYRKLSDEQILEM